VLEEQIKEQARCLNVLFVEDDPVTRELIKTLLEKVFARVYLARDGQEGLDLFQSEPRAVDLIISDISMPRMDGLEMMQAIRETNKEQKMIIISAHDETENLLRAIELGVDSFLIKPVFKESLERVLSRVVSDIHRDRELKNTEKLYVDALTGLPSRVKLLRDLEEIPKSSLFLINIDDFKAVNKLYGYDTGDLVLREMAERILEVVKQYRGGRLYRFPAGEFALMVPEALPEPVIESIACQILHVVDDNPFYIDDYIINVLVTIGISIARRPLIVRKRLFNADVALEQARERRLKYLLYREDLRFPRDYEHNLFWIPKLKEAVQDSRICPFFQPIINNRSGRVEKFEALARLIDTDGSIVPAGMFLGPAQKTIFFRDITRNMLLKSLEAFSRRECEFSVNISAAELTDPETRSFILHQLEQNQKTARRMTFEILESEGIENYEMARAFIREVKGYGCRVAIDDFGSGYSNFVRIMDMVMDIDYLKIDGSLIKNIHQDSRAAIIAESIVNISRKMGIQTIAEFVHCRDVFEKGREMGIDYSQGYYFGLPGDNLEIFLQE